MLFTPVACTVCIIVKAQQVTLRVTHVPAGNTQFVFADALVGSIVGVGYTIRSRFIDLQWLAINAPGNTVYPAIAGNA